jgi:DNA mismatch repair protein MutS2
VSSSFAAVEFDRVLRLVGSFARSERGRTVVETTPLRFSAGEGSYAFRLASEVARLVAISGTVPFAGLDAANLLDGSAPPAAATELAHLVAFVRCIVESKTAILGGAVAEGPLARLAVSLPQVEPLLAFCERRLAPDGEILDTASPALAQARAGRERSRHAIVAALDDLRRSHRQLAAPFTVRRERYCVPVPVGDRAAVSGLVLDVSSSGATLFIEPFAIVELNNALAEASARAREEEERILAELAATLGRHGDELRAAAATLATVDAFQARALFGSAVGGVLLAPGSGDRVRLIGARHVLLEPAIAPLRAEVLGEGGNTSPVVPLDLDFPAGARVVLLSGPNAGGKTVALKTLGLAALMVYAGIPVLADPASTLPPLGGVWCHVGDEQDLLSDLSTFSAAMRATTALLSFADAGTLVLYDELGSGTDPEEGAALAAALLEELCSRRCWTLATAHLTTVAAHLERLSGAINAAMGFDESSGRPTYALQMGTPGRSRGLAIAERCGVPAAVLTRARSLVSKSFLALDSHLARLQEEAERLVGERERLAALGRAADEARGEAAAAARRLDAEREGLRETLAAERDRLRARADQQLRAALVELQRAKERGELPSKKRVAAVRRTALDLEDAIAAVPPAPHLAPGIAVRVRGLHGEGVVKSLAGARVEVVLGNKRVWVEQTACELLSVQSPSPPTELAVTTADEPAASELKLIGLTQDEARDELERFIDRALIGGVKRIRVVHGHGSGTLRRMVRELLGKHPAVASFAHPPQFRGGTGVTEADLE